MICETMVGDNRFEIIAKAKRAILDSTNIETDEDEMKVLDNILFRCWQMGWLDKYDDTKKPTEWIPVSERLPDAEYGEGDSVLCCTELGLMYILYWHGGNWCVPTGEPHIWVNHKTGWHDRVIAWMPLPTPYKGGEDE